MIPRIIQLLIERDGSYFEVDVVSELPHIGHYEHPLGGEGAQHRLTGLEQDEAREAFSKEDSQDDEPDDYDGHFASVSSREAAERAAAGYGSAR
jgi:hypothetical protein